MHSQLRSSLLSIGRLAAHMSNPDYGRLPHTTPMHPTSAGQEYGIPAPHADQHSHFATSTAPIVSPPSTAPINAAPRPVATVYLNGSAHHLHCGQKLRIGRNPSLEFPINAPGISRHHCSIQADQQGNVAVIDENSTNGIYTQGQHMPSATIVLPFSFTLASTGGPRVDITTYGAPAPRKEKRNINIPENGDQAIRIPLPQIGTQVSIGRAPDNMLVLRDPLISRHHTVLLRTQQGFLVRNLRSMNGIYVNGRMVHNQALFTPRDHLSLGRTTLIFEGNYLVSEPIRQGATLDINHVSFMLKTGKKLLNNISFSVAKGELVAVVGPSGAGKSTLLKAITGSQPATSGAVSYQNRDLYTHYAQLRKLIGVVPQDDVVHRQLTVRHALSYAAELRLPSDYDKSAREKEVDRVINDLGLREHQDTQIAKLSGGQRKRTSVALELLTQPQLLLLDEPTSGLDPGLDFDVMRLLRAQADGGRTVLVVTHSTDNLQLCDKVLILAPGGSVAYYGDPAHVLNYFSMSRYAEVFKALSAQPMRWAQAWDRSHPQPAHPRSATNMGIKDHEESKPQQRRSRQWNTLIRRQIRIMAADTSYALSALIMPIILACLAFMIPGSEGFNIDPGTEEMSEPKQLLVILTLGAAFMGMSASVRELIDERAIFLRERAVGLSPVIYTFSKVSVLFVMTLVQSTIFVAVAGLRKPYPTDPLWAPSGAIELGVAVFATAFSCAMLGLLVSALVGTGDQTMPVLVITTMGQLAFCGGLFALNGRGILNALSWCFSGRWGFAMGASTVNTWEEEPADPKNPEAAVNQDMLEKAWEDPLWDHITQSWAIASAVIIAICVICIVATIARLKRQPATT